MAVIYNTYVFGKTRPAVTGVDVSVKNRSTTSLVDRKAAIRYVLGRQTPSGGFSYYRSWGVEEPGAADTYHALAILQFFGVELPHAESCRRWLGAIQGDNGSYSGLATAWYTLLALDCLDATPRRDVVPWLTRRADILFTQVEGEAYSPRLLELTRFIDLARRFHVATTLGRCQEAVTGALDEMSGPGGAFVRGAPNLVDTAQALRLIQVADLLPNRRMLDFSRSCEDPLYGFRAVPHGRSSTIEVLNAGVDLMRAFGAAPRHIQAIFRTIAACQRPGGGFSRQLGAMPTLEDTYWAVRLLVKLDRKNR